MRNLRRAAARLLGDESGQAMTESAVILMALLFSLPVLGFMLIKYAPDAVAAATIYFNGFYLVLGLPIG